MDKNLDEFYGVTKKDVNLVGIDTPSGKYLEIFESPGPVTIEFDDPEFTCRCPRTTHPDFGCLSIIYIPKKRCVELKSLKYFLQSFREEGHFHEEVVMLIHDDLRVALQPEALVVRWELNPHGGIYTTVEIGDDIIES